MFKCDLVKVKRNAQCRSTNTNCPYKGYGGIKKGEECLKVSMYSSSGTVTSFFCKKCMLDVIETFKKVIHTIEVGNGI